MSTRILPAIHDADAAGRVFAATLAKVDVALPGVWREERIGTWRVAFWCPPFPTYARARTVFRGPLRQLFAEAQAAERLDGQALAPGMVAALETALDDRSPSGRMHAIDAMAKAGPGARQLIPALRATLDDLDRRIAGFAADALGKVDPDQAALAELGRRALRDPARRRVGIKLLRHAGSVVELAGWLEDPTLAEHAASALAERDPLPAEILPALQAALARTLATVPRSALIVAVGNVRGAADRVLPVLLALAGDRAVTWHVVTAIAALDGPIEARRAALWSLASDPELVGHAVGALASLAVPAADLIAALDRKPGRDERARLARADALFAIAVHDLAALAPLEAAVDDRSTKVVAAVIDRIDWLASTQPEASRAALERASQHARREIRDAALSKLRR